MAAKNKTELNELKDFISDRFNKLEVGQAEIKGEIKTSDEKLSGQIKTVDEKLTGRINTLDEKVSGLDTRLKNVETSVQKIPELAEKVGEFKWWKQLILILSSGTVGAFLARLFSDRNLQ